MLAGLEAGTYDLTATAFDSEGTKLYESLFPKQKVISGSSNSFLLNLLPLGAIAAAVVAIAFSLVRPALLFLGFYKACDLCRSKLQPTQNP